MIQQMSSRTTARKADGKELYTTTGKSLTSSIIGQTEMI